MTVSLEKPDGAGNELLPVLSLTVVFDRSAGTAGGGVGGSDVDVAVVVVGCAASGGASAEELAVDASEASAPATDATMLAMVEEA